MSNMEAFNTITAQIQRELTENTIKATKEILAQTDSEIQGAKPMTKDDIVRMAIESRLIYDEEAHTPWIEDTNLTPFLECFAALVASAEREACADMVYRYISQTVNMEARGCLASVAYDIRARGQA